MERGRVGGEKITREERGRVVDEKRAGGRR